MDQKIIKNLEDSYEIFLDTTGTPEPKRPYSFYDDEYFNPKKNPSKKAKKENLSKKKSRRHKHNTAPYNSDFDFSSSEELSNEDAHPGNDSRYVWGFGYEPVFRPAKSQFQWNKPKRSYPLPGNYCKYCWVKGHKTRDCQKKKRKQESQTPSKKEEL